MEDIVRRMAIGNAGMAKRKHRAVRPELARNAPVKKIKKEKQMR